ncbi:hypothetical protein MMC12_005467 [Toensbergia leucococca]|nr:hypothetical protein [Toensbergia leucococca]
MTWAAKPRKIEALKEQQLFLGDDLRQQVKKESFDLKIWIIRLIPYQEVRPKLACGNSLGRSEMNYNDETVQASAQKRRTMTIDGIHDFMYLEGFGGKAREGGRSGVWD